MNKLHVLGFCVCVGLGCALVGLPVALFAGDYALVGWEEQYDEVSDRLNVNYINVTNCSVVEDWSGYKNCDKDVYFGSAISFSGECWTNHDEKWMAIEPSRCDYVFDNRTARVMFIGGRGCVYDKRRHVYCNGSVEQVGVCEKEFEEGYVPEKIYKKDAGCYRSEQLNKNEIFYGSASIFFGLSLIFFGCYAMKKSCRRSSEYSLDMGMSNFNGFVDEPEPL
ncbi:MAG: hypothetical protein Harvfovirus6_35 [Harvfovirus sp.]|uniref:Uncharacterized protein n=1 Tax=Harvfovirus sp. TaxID=2487768 RepID=A0A3G5A0R8_9VIRU|nr:MAG: hypothetical protein Harvfovirus6_35 [Harvfovirus sp.]